MSTPVKPKPNPPAPPAARRPPNGLPAAVADRRNQEISDVLHRAAEARAARDEVRLLEDDRANRREAAALLAVIKSHARPQQHPGPATASQAHGAPPSEGSST